MFIFVCWNWKPSIGRKKQQLNSTHINPKNSCYHRKFRVDNSKCHTITVTEKKLKTKLKLFRYIFLFSIRGR